MRRGENRTPELCCRCDGSHVHTQTLVAMVINTCFTLDNKTDWTDSGPELRDGSDQTDHVADRTLFLLSEFFSVAIKMFELQ